MQEGGRDPCGYYSHVLSKEMAGTTRLELATSAVTVQQPEVTSCNFTAPIATLGALRNPRELLLHPNCTQIAQVGFREFACFMAQEKGNGTRPLFPNADTIYFDDEQLPAVMVHRGMHLEIRCQSGDEFRKNFWVVVHLHRDNSFVVLGWIINDMGEVAVQGQQNGVDFLGLRNDDGVR